MKNSSYSRFRLLSMLHQLVLSIVAFSAISIVIAQFNGCASGPTSPGQSGATQTTTIYGQVVDETGKGLAGVSVAAGAMNSISDSRGMFIIKDAVVPQGRALVIGKKVGYFNAAHAEAPLTNGTTRIDLAMMSDATTSTLIAQSGGTIAVTGGASISFAAGSFTDASGAPYTGSVNIAARYLDPKNNNFFDYFSGDDRAQTVSGTTVPLISSGVLRVELHGSAGENLKLDASKPATLSYPKPIDTKAPAIMPLWYFDESLGMWKEEGSATLKNGFYTGTVTHFTDWNLDYKGDSSGGSFSTASVSLRVVCNGIPISGVAVSIVGDDAPGKYFVHPGGKTGPDGRINFLRFPDNRPTQIDISAAKNAGLYFINTPVNVTVNNGQSLDLGDISLNSPCPASITGTLVGCDGSPTEGLATISDGQNLSFVYTKNGNFAIQAAVGSVLTIDAMDVNGNQASTLTIPALASGELRNIGNLKICGTATATFVDITMGGSTKEGQIIALSPDGTKLAAWQSQTAQFTIYDTKTGNTISTTPSTGNVSLRGIYFSGDNKRMLLSGYSSATLYDVSGSTTSLLLTIPGVMNSRLSDDGTTIVAAAPGPYPAPPTLNIYSATDGSIVKTLHPLNFGTGSDSAGTFGYSQAENAVVYPDAMTARVWSIQNDVEIRNFAYTGGEYSFVTSEDGSLLKTTSDNITYSCFSTKTGLKVGDVKTSGSQSSRYGSQAVTTNYLYSSDQASGADVIFIWKIADGSSTLKLLSGSAYVGSISASRNEQYLAASTNGLIRIWKLQ